MSSSDQEAYERGALAERDRALRIILSELQTTNNEARRRGKENTREHAAVQVKLGLLYEMVQR